MKPISNLLFYVLNIVIVLLGRMVILEKITVSLAETPTFQRGVLIRFRGGMLGIKIF